MQVRDRTGCLKVAMNETVSDVFPPIQFSVVADPVLVNQPVCVVTGLNETARALLLHSVKPVCWCRETMGFYCVGGRLHTALKQIRVKIGYVSQTIRPFKVVSHVVKPVARPTML